MRDSLLPSAGTETPIVGNRVELQLYTTLRCNLKCTYCSESVGDVLGSQGNVAYSFEALERFIDTHLKPYEVYVTFYGGEPTLNIPFMQEMMDRHPVFRYQLQTNGTLLNRLPEAMLARFSNILVSIDGGEATTDGYRGKGVFGKVTKNLKRIRDTVQGSLTARVTWSHPETSFAELDGLLESFDYLYFQFAQCDGVYDGPALERKTRVLEELVARFFASSQTLYPVIPLMGVVRNKLLPSRAIEGTQGLTQCRASTHILNVLPDGRIFPCPDMTYVAAMQHGDINGNWLARSPLQPTDAMPCGDCSAFAYCRRNCMKNLYRAYVEGDVAYRRAVVEPVCELLRRLGEIVDRHDPLAWYVKAPLAVRRELADCEVYEYVEVMP